MKTTDDATGWALTQGLTQVRGGDPCSWGSGRRPGGRLQPIASSQSKFFDFLRGLSVVLVDYDAGSQSGVSRESAGCPSGVRRESVGVRTPPSVLIINENLDISGLVVWRVIVRLLFVSTELPPLCRVSH